MTLLRERQLRPWEVKKCDPDFIDEVMAEITAAADYQLFNVTEPDQETRTRQIKRKAELAKWRDEERKR